MKEKYKNNYKIDSMRNQKWDYSWNGAYFITIVTKKRHPYFGEIQNNKMILNEIGKLARNHWLQIPNHFPFIKLDRYVIMPDHFHGLLWIEKDKACLFSTNDQNLRDDKDKACLVSTNDQNLCNDKDKACLVSMNDKNLCNDKDKACLVSTNDQNPCNDKDKACLVSTNDQNLCNDKDKACLVSTNDQNPCNDKDKACLVSMNDQNLCNDKDMACLVSTNDQNLCNDKDKACLVSTNDQNLCNDKDKACLVSTNDQNLCNDKDKACLVSSGHDQMNRFRNPGKFSISTVIGSFKSSVTKTAKRVNHQFGWQSGFHDRIIRNEIILNKVRNYIIENPARWESNEDIL